MKWLKRFVLLALALVAVGVALRLWAPLPSLEGRTVSQALQDTADTAIGRALAAGVPVLTAVNQANLAGFEAFSAGMGTALPAQGAQVMDWCMALPEAAEKVA